MLPALKGNFESWNALFTIIFQAEKGEEAGSVGGIWFLSAQARVKVWGWEVERNRLFTFSSFCVRVSQLLACLFSQGAVGL